MDAVIGTNNNKNDDNDDNRNLEVTTFHDDDSSNSRDAMRLETRGVRRVFVPVDEGGTALVTVPSTVLIDLVETISGGTKLNPDANDREDAHHTARTRRRHGQEAEETFMMLVVMMNLMVKRPTTREPTDPHLRHHSFFSWPSSSVR